MSWSVSTAYYYTVVSQSLFRPDQHGAVMSNTLCQSNQPTNQGEKEMNSSVDTNPLWLELWNLLEEVAGR